MGVGGTVPGLLPYRWRSLLVGLLSLASFLASATLALHLAGVEANSSTILESTPGQLALWLVEQSQEENPESLLGRYARARLDNDGNTATLTSHLLREVKILFVAHLLLLTLVSGFTVYAFWRRRPWRVWLLVSQLLAVMSLLFLLSPEGAVLPFRITIILGILSLILLFSSSIGLSRAIGFFAFLSALLLGWELLKIGAEALDYRVTQPMPGWRYTTYPDLGAALDDLQAGKVDVVIADRRLLDDQMPPHPSNSRLSDEMLAALPRPELRYARDLEKDEFSLFFPNAPKFPSRLSFASRQEDAGRWSDVAALRRQTVAAELGSYADERYLQEARELVLLDLRIFNDKNLPHLQSIARAFTQPARRNGPYLLASILSAAAFFTLMEAILGFAIGATLGFILGVLFAHSRLLERSLLPYVVASQTIPILAFAPMVVIWLGAGPVSVAIIAAYLTFFPVTINTLRGLLSPSANALELMRSFAASRLEILWKLRLPAALPYLFTALKVSATASVVGAIIGELPSGISNGLGRAILNFSSDYSLVSTPKLWASIITAAGIGILFFLSVSLVEWRLLRQSKQTS